MRTPGIFLAAIILFSCSVQREKNQETPLLLELEMLTSPDYNGSGVILSQLTISNQSQDTIFADDWAICFNAHGISNADTSGLEVNVKWINADYNQIIPTADWQALAPGQSKVVSLKMRNLQNMINIPRGFYFVSPSYPEGVAVAFNLKTNTHLEAYDARVAADIYERNTRRVDLGGEQSAPVFPTPASYTWREDAFDLANDLVIVSDPAFLMEANYLQRD